ncbi:MAG: sigma-54-dependent Fis family transcriptional regulator [bacterium]|nr:sigma-54-dependent Fis family transcriptional regulator [bacterium]
MNRRLERERVVEEAYALGLRGRTADAVRMLETALAAAGEGAAGERPTLQLALVRLLAADGSDESRRRARELMQRLAADEPGESWRARLELARVHRDEGRSEEAAEILSDALQDFRSGADTDSPAADALASLISGEVEALTRGDVDRARSLRPSEDALDAGRLAPLIRLSKRMVGTTDSDELLRIFLHEAIALTGSDRGFVVLVRGAELEFAAAENLDRSTVAEPALEVSRSLIEEVCRSGRVEFLEVAELDTDHPATRSLSALGVRHVTCVPIAGSLGTIGVLYLDRRERRSLARETERKLLEVFAAQAAASLAAARTQSATNRALEAAEETIRLQRSGADRRLRYRELIGASDAMQEVYRQLDLIIPTEEPVILYGETGTGKDLVARTIHDTGARGEREFVAVNCASLSETLLESELFGHERGAFTGADRARAGLLELAHGGTLFLDEVGEMSPRMQAELLRALQSGEIRRVGGSRTSRVDVRVIAATHRNLAKRVEQGEFRRDLYYRLNVLSIHLPPLRDRIEDVPQFVRELMPRRGGDDARPNLTPAAMARLLAYHWPGNVRELDNVLRRLAVLGRTEIDERHLPAELSQPTVQRSATGTLREVEAEAIRRALETTGNNKTRAARMLGIDRTTLYAKLRQQEP